MTCFICYSSSDNSSMNFVIFSDDRCALRLATKEEVDKSILAGDNVLEEQKICDECLVSLRREAAEIKGLKR